MSEPYDAYGPGDAGRAALNLSEAIMRKLNWDRATKRQVVEAAIAQMEGFPESQGVLRALFSPLWEG
jgi:hypothetical protein